jgi:hypothetical protein
MTLFSDTAAIREIVIMVLDPFGNIAPVIQQCDNFNPVFRDPVIS